MTDMSFDTADAALASGEGGFLADLGLDTVETDPNHLPNATYLGYLTKVKVQPYKDASRGKAIIFTYKVSDGEHSGKTVDEWKSANSFDDSRKKAWLKQRMLSLGIPESRLGAVNPDDLVGLPVRFTVKQNGEYTNVTFVALRDEDETADSGTSITDNL